MKAQRVTINNLFAGYARAGMDPQDWYENLTDEQRVGAQLDFIEARAELLQRLPHEGNPKIPANVQVEAKRLGKLVQQAVAAMSQNQMIPAGGFMLEAGVTMQRISTQLVAAEALDVTGDLQNVKRELQENQEHITRGLKVLDAASASGQTRNARFQEVRPEYQPYIEAQLEQNPSLTYADLQRRAATKFDVSACTIKRYTTNPRKK